MFIINMFIFNQNNVRGVELLFAFDLKNKRNKSTIVL